MDAIVTAAKASLISQRSTSVGLPADLFQQFLEGKDRGGSEPGRVMGKGRVADNPRQRRDAGALGVGFAHQHKGRCAVGNRRRVGGCNRSILLECRLQLGDLRHVALHRRLVEGNHFFTLARW
jgi:hypothetical protein